MVLSLASQYMPLLRVLGLLHASHAFGYIQSCRSSIYCGGELLHRVQMARIFNDSKTFVDMKLKYNEREIINDFEELLRKTNHEPTRKQLFEFVSEHFVDEDELDAWSPPDFNPEPLLLDKIKNLKLRAFAKDIIGIWSILGRRVSDDVNHNPDNYSLIAVPNGFIIPGGRFKEIYYWDSFWIIRGLLISGMTNTARGMIENLLYLVEKFGHVPNGSRTYYLGRSQPPLLAAMASDYFKTTRDLKWLKQNIQTIEMELRYWINKKTVTIQLNGNKYVLLRYVCESKGPRPESYFEDYTNAQRLKEKVREDFYADMKSAAESGWDFSTRWFVAADGSNSGNLSNVHARRIIPVDLNAIFAGALETVGDFRNALKDKKGAMRWWNLARNWRDAIDAVLWDPVDGIWYDFNALANTPRRYFYPSCMTPLWAGSVEADKLVKYTPKVIHYLLSSGGLSFPGGIPTSMIHSGQQWDYPNAWPPLQSILIGGLEATGDPFAIELAKKQAEVWVNSNFIGYQTWKKMFEKYDVSKPGEQGEGGEYASQFGFGWTNGVALELLQRYGSVMSVENDVSD